MKIASVQRNYDVIVALKSCFLSTFRHCGHGVGRPAVPAADLIKTVFCMHARPYTYTYTYTKALHRQDKPLSSSQHQKRLWSGRFHYSRKWVDKWRLRQWDFGGLKMSLFVVGIPSFVQATPVAIRLWIVSQEQDPNPPFPALVQLFPVWNWLLSFGLIKVLSA